MAEIIWINYIPSIHSRREMEVRDVIRDLEGRKAVVVGFPFHIFLLHNSLSSHTKDIAILHSFLSSSSINKKIDGVFSRHIGIVKFQNHHFYFNLILRLDGVSHLAMTLGWEMHRWVFFFFREGIGMFGMPNPY